MVLSISSIGISLLILSATAQASLSSSISLGGNFQQLPFGITGECRTVYNLPIENCSSEDFQAHSACSQACAASLQSLSDTLNTVCPGVIVDSRSLLGLIFQNRLVQSVCSAIEEPGQPGAPGSTTMSPAYTSVPTTTSIAPPQSSSSEAPSSASSTTSVKAPSKSSAAGLGNPDPTPVSTPTQTQLLQPTTSSKDEKPSGRSRQQEQIFADRFSGGGSPFDMIMLPSAAVHRVDCPIKSLIGALLVAVILAG